MDCFYVIYGIMVWSHCLTEHLVNMRFEQEQNSPSVLNSIWYQLFWTVHSKYTYSYVNGESLNYSSYVCTCMWVVHTNTHLIPYLHHVSIWGVTYPKVIKREFTKSLCVSSSRYQYCLSINTSSNMTNSSLWPLYSTVYRFTKLTPLLWPKSRDLWI